MLKAVVFDLDNTIYDYDKCNTLAEKKLFQMMASEFALNEDEAKSILRNAKNNIKNQLGDTVASSHNRLLYMQNICEQLSVNPLNHAMKLYNCYWDAMLEQMTPFDYVVPIFEKFKEKNIKIAILTDLTAHIQYRKMECLGIANYVDCLVTSEEAGAEKPSKCMFELILRKLKLPPNDVLMVGDSKSKDVDGAIRCGMQAYLFTNEESFIEFQRTII